MAFTSISCIFGYVFIILVFPPFIFEFISLLASNFTRFVGTLSLEFFNLESLGRKNTSLKPTPAFWELSLKL